MPATVAGDGGALGNATLATQQQPDPSTMP